MISEFIPVKKYGKIDDGDGGKQNCCTIFPNLHHGISTVILFHFYLFPDQRSFPDLHQELPFTQPVAISFFTKMYLQIFNTYGIAVRYIGDIAMTYFMTIDDDH